MRRGGEQLGYDPGITAVLARTMAASLTGLTSGFKPRKRIEANSLGL
jgi:hypothetical protein